MQKRLSIFILFLMTALNSNVVLSNENVPIEYEKAHSLILSSPHQSQIYYQEAIRKGLKKAYTDIGMLYAQEGFSKEGHDLAKIFFDAAISNDDPFAYIGLGYLYENGWSVDQDFSKAGTYYKKAISLGDKDGYLQLAHMAETQFLSTEPYKVKEAYEIAARQGLTTAIWGFIKLFETYPNESVISQEEVLFWYLVHQKRYHVIDIPIEDSWFKGLTDFEIKTIEKKAEALNESFSDKIRLINTD